MEKVVIYEFEFVARSKSKRPVIKRRTESQKSSGTEALSVEELGEFHGEHGGAVFEEGGFVDDLVEMFARLAKEVGVDVGVF